MSQLVVSVAGAAVGFAIGGPAGAKWGWMAGSLLGSAFTPNQKVEGPRLEDLSVSSSAYGAVLPYLEGHTRMGGQVIWASTKREIATTEEQGGKGGGGTDVTTYTYEVDMHIMLTDCPIYDVTRIWVNGKLIYSMKDGNTPGTTEASDNTNAWTRMTVYTGAADQMPDPDGHPDAPAYRGRGSIFFKNYGLGQSGAMPNLTFEVTRQGEPTPGLIYGMLGNDFCAWNGSTAALVRTVTPPAAVDYFYLTQTKDPVTGYFWVTGNKNYPYPTPDEGTVSEIDMSTGTVIRTFSFTADSDVSNVAVSPDGATVYVLLGWSAGRVYTIDTATGTTAYLCNVFPDYDGFADLWLLSADGSELIVFIEESILGVRFYGLRFFNTSTGTQTGALNLDPLGYNGGDCQSLIWNHDKTKIWLSWGHVVKVDYATRTVDGHFTLPLEPLGGQRAPGGLALNADESLIWVGCHIWNEIYKYTATPTYTLLSTYAHTVPYGYSQRFQMTADYTKIWVYCWSYGTLLRYTVADNILDSFYLDVYGEHQPWIDDQGSLTVLTEPTLRNVVERLCAMSGLAPTQYDASALDAITQKVHGMALSQVTSVRVALEQLASAYFFECRLSDKLYFTPRATTTVGSISYVDMAASDSIGGDNDPLPLTQINELEIPSQMALTYICEANDYQTDTQYSDRLISSQENTSTNQLSLNFSASEAKAIVDSLLLDKVISALQTSFNVNRSFSKYEVNDVVTVTDRDGEVYTMRLITKKESDGVITFRAVKDDASILTQSGTTTAPDNSQTVVLAVGATEFTVLDVNLFFDATDEPGVFVAVDSVETDGWDGCTVYRSSDNVTYTSLRTTSSKTVIGSIDTQPPVFTGGDIVDRINTVTVTVGTHNTLSSITRDRMLEDESANAAIIGHEIVQFQTATLVSPGVYVLSNFLRGRRGTEYLMGYAVDNNRFVLLQTGGLVFVPVQSSELARLRYWKAVSNGQRIADVPPASLTPYGINMRPIAPVHAHADRDTTDTEISWLRRTRLSTRFTGDLEPSAPLGEETESYEVEIYTTSGFTTVARTLTSTTPTVTYTSAQQTTDFGSGQTVLYVKIYQLSAIVGRGTPLTATI